MFSRDGVFYRSWGDGDRTALLLHGFASSSLTWRKLAKDLAGQGYRVIAPDLTGHGRSPRANKYSLDAWAEDVKKLDIRPDLIVGHSMGGLVAAHIQPHFQASRIVLVDPVYRLPFGHLLLGSTQVVFASVLIWRRLVKARLKNLGGVSNLREEFVNLHRWDWRTVRALKPNSKSIVSLLKGSGEVLLLRARGSFIVPTHLLNRKHGEKVRALYFEKAGHNMHQDAYDDFWTLLSGFVPVSEIVTTKGVPVILTTDLNVDSSITV